MTLTVVVTSNVEDRYRGFLSSVMLEIAAGVYTSARMSSRVREHVWTVMAGWHQQLCTGTVVMTWLDREAPGGQQIRTLGAPLRDIIDVDGMTLVCRSRAP